jgi:hypothetical protein
MLTAGFVTLGLTFAAAAQEAISPRPPVEFVVAPGEASAVPIKKGVSWANGGVIDVAQPNATTLIVTMSGITATNADLLCKSIANYDFQLTQAIGINFNSKRVVGAKLSLEGRVIGLLRTNHEYYTRHCGNSHCGIAETHPATATVTNEAGEIASLALPARQASGCDDLSVYNHEGPFCVPVICGKYVLHETWGFGTTHPAFFCRGASAEFAPQPQHYRGANSYWFEHFEPFNGSATKDFGYQVVLKLVPEFKAAEEEEKGGEPIPAPKGKGAPEDKPKDEPTPEKKPADKEKP